MLIRPGRIGLVGSTRRSPPGINGFWAPTDLGAARAAEWAASDLADGSPAAWIDRVTSLSLSAAGSPVKSATAFNGAYHGVTFDGVDDCFTTTSLGALPTGATAGELWFIGRLDSSGAQGRMINCGNGGALSRIIMKSAGNVPQGSDGTTAINFQSSVTGSVIVNGTWSGTEQRLFVNGVAATNNPVTIATLATNNTRLRIGANAVTTPANFFLGVGAHAFVILGILSDADRARLTGWCAHAYGITSVLPNQHPYKLWRP